LLPRAMKYKTKKYWNLQKYIFQSLIELNEIERK
jgi:hypothetical protein